ncbi:recombinase family protein [Chitinophaga tropicalis]|uniref:Resolvase/invertase-type recombinase catalytic domain-containing protein n=1 Tax=Chitinophaga tropicalis TaxID=2683588 RepID=A0A7K1U6R8_9BACT|nr:recombinase family protein [Chitinophaga tropicalis]MVT10054.1 hypothetical protein [Chitinophaga tropicalis]
MKSAHLYCRVSTDEQKRKGHSLIEQEDRLIKHCENNNILIKGIYREDYSAKDFNRPEWKRLIKKIPGRAVRYLPAPPQSRASSFPAHGSSIYGFAS